MLWFSFDTLQIGEQVERLWAALSPYIAITTQMTGPTRIDLLSMVFREYNSSNELAMPSRLVDKFTTSVSVYDEASVVVGGIEECFGYTRQNLANLKLVIASTPAPKSRNRLTVSDSGNCHS